MGRVTRSPALPSRGAPADPSRFLPTSPGEMAARGWDRPDFLLVSGDAYVDHSSFGFAVVGRFLESLGFRVALLPQPDWHTPEPFASLGRPRLAALVTAGNLDSLVCHFTAEKKRRRRDEFSPGGEPGHRPDRATLVYCNRIRELWKDLPLIVGGIEASLRRLAHYDYWSDEVRRSLLVDCRADLLVYGMGEVPLERIARGLEEGRPVESLREVPGTCYRVKGDGVPPEAVRLPSYDAVRGDGRIFCDAFRLASEEQDPFRGRPLAQDQGAWWVVQNPPAPPLSPEELDRVYELPFTGEAHPRYSDAGVPALEEVRFSLTSHRGCFGDCSFCALSLHQGRRIQRRTIPSLIREATALTERRDFKGTLHDVGGPTANFRVPPCEKARRDGPCRGRTCLGPSPCPNLRADHRDYRELLRRLRSLPGVRKVFVRSGLRYDYLLLDPDGSFLEDLCAHHVSGQLRIAPEHASDAVTARMNKPGREVLERFMERFAETNRKLGKDQYLVYYFMTSHPGCTLTDAVELAEFLHRRRIRPREVQDFTPTPGSRSTCMYHTGLDPLTGEPVHVPRGRERHLQRALVQYWMPENASLVREALRAAGREDLIGTAPRCLVPPEERRRTGKDDGSGSRGPGTRPRRHP